MSSEDEMIEHLFSYGTLKSEAVQLATFGRRLEGRPDTLVGYRVATIRIQDPAFVAASGAADHRIVQSTGVRSDVVEGTVLTVTREELAQADAYEPAGYRRVRAELGSGASAWVYVDSR